MTEEKQIIEEMAITICRKRHACILKDDESCRKCDQHERCLYQDIAYALYQEDYRKQSENTVELPCKVGDKVWCISNYTNPKEFQITILTMSENHYSFVIEADKGVYKHYCDKDSVGRYVFFTKEEAEQALAKMKGGKAVRNDDRLYVSGM